MSIQGVPEGQQDEYLGTQLRNPIRFIHQFLDFLLRCVGTLKGKTRKKNLFFDNFSEQQLSWLDGMLPVGRNSAFDRKVSSACVTSPAPDVKPEYVSKLFIILP